ncbi:protein RESPONSE TO ABA AND SALT 1-like [Benincasa hispida]|uniref:protein RESPONSE TO ABA AND SALT 1-like n=1 Tax=Benincasa hispida TaxID=102211 RepID=UPI001901BD38|nr:protein RESPONSE TO ABA AND SALT 1-like [Benincasa hispida]
MPGDHYNADSFKAFFDAWLLRQRNFLDDLLSAESGSPHDGDLQDLISRVLSHYEDYYEKKSRIAQTDIFLVFSPPWFTTYERTLLWIGGFRPGLTFRLVNQSINDMSDEQVLRIRRLRDDVKIEERLLNNDLAKIQEKVAAPPLLEFFRRGGHDGVIGGEEAMENLKAAFQSVLASADFFRRDTALKVTEILTPAQAVRFWAAVAQLHLRIRALGLQEDAE